MKQYLVVFISGVLSCAASIWLIRNAALFLVVIAIIGIPLIGIMLARRIGVTSWWIACLIFILGVYVAETGFYLDWYFEHGQGDDSPKGWKLSLWIAAIEAGIISVVGLITLGILYPLCQRGLLMIRQRSN